MIKEIILEMVMRYV